MFHPLINLLLTLVIIVILLRFKLPLGLVMFLGALVLGILYKVPVLQQLLAVKTAILSPVFLQLGVALNIIMFLENILRTRGYLGKTLDSLKILIPNSKITMMILPAFLGLLPSPGGAVFSAPLVAEAGKDLEMSPEIKSTINYWFRHLWEYFFPLYPGVILGSQILQIPLSKIAVTLGWVSILAICLGYLVIIRPIQGGRSIPNGRLDVEPKAMAHPSRAEKGRALWNLLAGTWPVILIVLTVMFFHFDVGLTVLGTMILLLLLNRYRWDDLKKLGKESFKVSIVYLIAGILIFKEMLQVSGVVAWLPGFLHSAGIPDLLVVICLTSFVGFATGLSQAYIGATFPLLTGIIGIGAAVKPGMLILAYLSGFVGLMISPIHLCFMLTIQYFKADFIKVWRRIILPELAILAVAIACALLL
jgi:integral membrane protein (TIGR00529 family)